MTKQQIARINELAAKSKTQEGLTQDEKQEQKLLREQYVQNMRSSLKAQLSNISVMQDDGSVEPLSKKGEKPS